MWLGMENVMRDGGLGRGSWATCPMVFLPNVQLCQTTGQSPILLLLLLSLLHPPALIILDKLLSLFLVFNIVLSVVHF